MNHLMKTEDMLSNRFGTSIKEKILLLFYIECVIGCSGRWLSFGSVSIRMVLFGLCFLFLIPGMIHSGREVFSNPGVISALLLAIWMAVCTVSGLRRGNRLGFIVSDWTSILSLVLLPGMLAVIRTRDQIKRLLTAVFWSAAFVGIFSVALHFLLAWMPGSSIKAMESWFLRHSMGGLTMLSSGIYRVYFRSQIFLVVGLVIGLWLLWQKKSRMRIMMLVMEGLMAAALLLSYTRGFWIGAFISMVLVIILEPKYWKRYLITLLAIALVLIGMFALSWISYGKPAALKEFKARFSSKLVVLNQEDAESILEKEKEGKEDGKLTREERVALENQKALEMRSKTILGLHKNIRKHPVIGSGMGANLDGVREDGRTEYMYEDLLFKTGAVGLVLFLLTFFFPVIEEFRFDWKERKRRSHSWEQDAARNRFLIAAYIGIAVTSAMNPFLNTPMGIAVLLLISVSVNSLKNERSAWENHI